MGDFVGDIAKAGANIYEADKTAESKRDEIYQNKLNIEKQLLSDKELLNLKLESENNNAAAQRELESQLQLRQQLQDLNLQQKQIESQYGLQEAEQKFQGSQSEAQRALERELQAKNIETQKELQTQQIGSAETQSEAQRALERELQAQQLGTQEKLQERQLGSTETQSEAQRALERELQTQQLGTQKELQTQQLGTQKELQAQQIGSTEKISELDRAEREALRNASRSGLDTAQADLYSQTENMTPELSAYQQSIRDLSNKDLQEAQKQEMANLSRLGVRGGQAAVLLGRKTGDLQQQAFANINQLAYEDALKRNQARQQLLQTKASGAASGAFS